MTQLEPERFQFTSADGLFIACVKWSGHHPVRGVVQIAHGLGEHMGRYAELAETLVHGHFVVYGNDHRGHGLTAKPSGSFGEFGPGGFDQLVEDMISLRVIAKNEHPGKPYILLGHSMKYVYLFPVVCALSLAGLLASSADKNGDKKSEAKPITVTMKSLSYDPKKLEVHVGDSVVWTNEAHTTHTATSDDEGNTFDIGEIEPGKSSKPVKLEKEGEFKYHCKVHGKAMSGTIVVEAERQR